RGSHVSYRLSEDGFRTLASGDLPLKGGRVEVAGSLDRPGFLRCDLTWAAGDDTVKAVAACGFAVESIRPTGRLPEDYSRFWREASVELVRIPVDPRLEEVVVDDLPGARRYRVSLASVGGGRVFGWLTLPPGDGPFPAVLAVPGAGVGRTAKGSAYARDGFAVFSINVHGIEPDREDEYYERIKNGPMGGYDYLHYGKQDPYHFYFRRVIQDCMRALDYMCSRDDIDTTRIGMMGSSQGGFLSLMTASADKRIKGLVASVPGLCDHTGSLYGRAAGGPQLLDDVTGDATARVVRTLSYYDAALAAQLIKAPALLGIGFLDAVCPPTTVYAAYNNLAGCKAVENFETGGHGHGSPEGWGKRSRAWLLEKLNERSAVKK
ncbi:MAG: acetylxylan esterase, partial [Gemmatimonadota bacterium]|nr:acetylxylan esterase [Gemmatimonadota bacterium]